MSQTERRKWIALILLCMVQFMVILDIAIVNVALPSIQTDLGFTQENLQWVISAYSLVFGGFLLLGGRLADLLGRRRVFMVGLVIFTVGSLLCGLSWSEGSLIAARALQGLGAATISPAALSILTTMFREGRERNIALGAWGAVGGVGAAAGVLLGGVLVDLLSWPWIFYVNVPVGIISLIATPILLSESRDERESSFDVLGAVLVTSGLSILVLGITKGHDWGWSSGQTIGVFAVSAVLLVAFVVQESRAAHPLMPFSIFRLQTLTAANIVMFIMGTAIISANVAAAAVTRVGVKPTLVTGMSVMTVGLVLFSQVSVDGSYWKSLFPGFLVIGFGMPLAFVSLTIAALAGTREHEAGLASGLINTSQQIGGAVGIAILSTVATSTTSDSVASGTPVPSALTQGFQHAFWAGAAIAFVGVLVSLFLVRQRDFETAPALEASAEPV